MVRLVGVDLPRKKRVAYALTYIHGIGLTSAKKIIEIAGIDPEKRSDDLSTEETIALRQTLEDIDLQLEGDLRRFNGLNIKRLNEINCHRGKDIETVCLFEDNELEQMLAHDVERKKLLRVRKNNFICNICIWHKQLKNRVVKEIEIVLQMVLFISNQLLIIR